MRDGKENTEESFSRGMKLELRKLPTQTIQERKRQETENGGGGHGEERERKTDRENMTTDRHISHVETTSAEKVAHFG